MLILNIEKLKSSLNRILSVGFIAIAFAAALFYRQANAAALQSGKQLTDNYYVFDQQMLQQDTGNAGAVLLNFYATWCGSCNEMEPRIFEVFNEIGVRENLKGYRVNFGDKAETAAGRALAQQYNITTQSAIVVLDGQGKVFKTFLTSVSAETLKLTLISATLVS